MASLIEKLLRTGDKKTLRQLRNYADSINALEDSFKTFTDAELREETDRLRERHQDGEKLDDLLPEAFAAVREASSRTLGMRHFDVQLMGGAALHLGNIAEMKTGEGKTLVATAPAYLNALSGKGVHVVTVNDYLAEYQSDLMGRVYRFLGLTSGCILSNQDPSVRRQMYAADITYGTNNEFGFDYLRDNMAWDKAELVQRGHHFAIVDEVDSILIDEARTPLIISGPAQGDTNRWYSEFAKVVLRLQPEKDYEVDEKKRTVGVLESGIEKVEDYLGIQNLYESANTPLIGFLNNAIKAKELFKRDKDYVILDGEVLIVDEHTGRILAGRRYNEGMHQAIEAKEGVEIKAENQTLATVTLQNYFRMYHKLSGMTGTAETEAAEFMSTYKLGVVPIPTNRDMQRIDQPDLVFKNETVKFDAVVKDIAERHEKGQPVLVGTTSVEKSEYLSRLLAKEGIRHEVLNAKNHAREAAIVAQAGRKGAVTVATNMAGRGTDIMLGGNAEFTAVAELAKRGLDPEENSAEYESAWPDALEAAKQSVKDEHEEVLNLGGLYVLGTERHESRRIDNQLRGRSGRQGDPGESRFYLSLTDDLMRLFNSGAAERLMNSSVPDDVALESKLVSRAIASAQGQVEGRNAEQRKNVLKYDDVLNRQREAIYGDRRRILEGDDLHEKVQYFVEDTITALIDAATAEGNGDDWDFHQLWTNLKTLYPVSVTPEEIIEEAGGKSRLTVEMLKEELLSDARLVYQAREETIGSESMRELERRVVLSVIGRKWQEHLYEMDYLKEGIGLRAMAQRDPLVEYQREGFALFQSMMEAIREESVGFLFNLEVEVTPAQDVVVADAEGGHTEHVEPQVRAAGLEAPAQPAQLQYTAPSESGGTQTRVETRQSGRSGNPAKAAAQDAAKRPAKKKKR
ncbi:preprotein translocase, SecA subunit [Pseudarthrobacter siccitolerans]|uniref:Protein translocase subunit SecA n=1 Tax=Pseudarthrobacter siccitolerans TaxID=861266 RepID=A0A024H1E0_9MICC|nr:preprotein translocase subunit SecA [Pseudarthrobacter siccitolerans]CCQ45541.1 preprotein translocase, SecA subunit [Pseudarthrobacter siccitolerans]